MDQQFRVLVLDDSMNVGFAFERVLDIAREVFPAEPVVVTVPTVEEVRRRLSQDVPFDVAVIDLGLGPRQESGLSALELLAADQVRTPSVVHTDHQEQTRRLLFLYAAFSWFDPVMLLPKGGGHSGSDQRVAAMAIGRALVAAAQRRTTERDPGEPFRPSRGKERAFEHVIKTQDDLHKWRSFVALSTNADVARDLHLRSKTIENWVASKLPVVRRLLDEAHEAGMDVTDATVAEHSAGHQGQAVIHQFARSQSWFFMDPTVGRRFGLTASS